MVDIFLIACFIFQMAFTLCITVLLCSFAVTTDAVVPSYLASNDGTSRLDMIKIYFQNGFTYKEILLLLLSRHNILLSLSHLKRILSKANMRRRQGVTYASRHVTEQAINNELLASGQCLGYRSMWRRLLRDHGLTVKRSTVMNLLREIDPEGCKIRKAHRLKIREYIINGPNYMWHIDGYDKLKPYGLCIHNSRRLIWLEVSSSNNNPRLIAKYYLDALKQLKCAPRIVRADHVTENSYHKLSPAIFQN